MVGAKWHSRLSLGIWGVPILAVLLASADALAENATGEYPTTQQPAAVPTEYDPFAGMDANGRIPAPARPEGLPNPGRWRYLPEGRLKPGNIFQRLLVSSFIAPFGFHSSDVGTGFGLSLTDFEFRKQRRREFLGASFSYSTEGQQEYELSWKRWLHHLDLPGGGILQEERSLVEAEVGYFRTLTARFFGLGPDSRLEDETSYADASIFGGLSLELAVPEPGSDFVLTLGAWGESHSLSRGRVEDTPSTGDVFPGLFRDAEQRNLGWLIGGLRWDTRDSQKNPYAGWHVEGEVAGAPLQSGGERGAVVKLGAGKVFRVPPLFHDGGDRWEENPPTDTVAFGLWNDYAVGDLPFFALPALGGPNRHRGFIGGRFRGRASWLSAVEYRFWLIPRGIAFTRSIRIERIGAAVFYETGTVVDRAADLIRQRPLHSYGASIRFSLERAAPFRLDFGFSEEGNEFNTGFGLSF